MPSSFKFIINIKKKMQFPCQDGNERYNLIMTHIFLLYNITYVVYIQFIYMYMVYKDIRIHELFPPFVSKN